MTKLSPKKWGLSGTSSFLLATLFAGVSFLLNQGIDIRPNIAAVLGLAMLDAILLGGSCLAQISSFWPPYKRRICVHEAGHLLVGKLYFCKCLTEFTAIEWKNFRTWFIHLAEIKLGLSVLLDIEVLMWWLAIDIISLFTQHQLLRISVLAFLLPSVFIVCNTRRNVKL